MLLRDSEVAKQIRTYLLNVEESTPREQRTKSLEYLGTWTSKEELILLDCFYSTINNGGSLNEAAQKASEKINHTKSACLNRYNFKLKDFITDESFFETVKQNRKNKGNKSSLKLISAGEIQPEKQSIELEKLEQIHNSQVVVIDEMFKRNTQLMNDVFELKDENKSLLLKVKEIESDLTIKDILMIDKDRQIEILTEKNIHLSEENDTLIKKSNTYRSKLNNIQAAMNGKPVTKKKQHKEENSRKGIDYKIKDGVPVFQK